MAKRPVFIAKPDEKSLVKVRSVDFEWHAGMAMSRRKLSMLSLHQAIREQLPDAKILEVSRMSDVILGEKLSAFNLTLPHPSEGGEVPLECAFQASKVFERGGPYTDLLCALPADAKRDSRLQSSGQISCFRFGDVDWPKHPPTAFYDWMYINAIKLQPNLADKVMDFDVFTDIAFNPAKSINCQAHAVALFVALRKTRRLDDALASKADFLKLEEAATLQDDSWSEQGSLL